MSMETFPPEPTGVRVLFVEDEPAAVEMELSVLRQAGFDPTWDRVEAERTYVCALDDRPDVIISDCSAPEFTTLRALELLQQRGLDIPFVVVSATVSEDTAAAFVEKGAVNCLGKDRLGRLGGIVRVALEERARRARLTAAEARYKDIFDNATEAMYEATLDGTLIAVNPALVSMLGYTSADELLGRVRLDELFADPERGLVFWRLLRELGTVSGFEARLRCRGGRQISTAGQARRMKENKGHVVGSWFNVTHLKQAEQLLTAQYAISRVLAEAESLDVALTRVMETLCTFFSWDAAAMWTVDTNTARLRCTTFWQRPGIDLSSFEEDSRHVELARGVGLPGQVWATREATWLTSMCETDDLSRRQSAARVGLQGEFCHPIFFKGEITDVIEFVSHEARSVDHQFMQITHAVCGMIGMFISRRRAEIAQEESDRRFRQLAENIPEVFWLSDPSSHTMFYVSPAYERIFGRSCQSLYDDPRSFVDAIHADDRAAVLEGMKTRKKQHGRLDVDYRIRRPDGTTRWIRTRTFPIFDRQGQFFRVAGITDDITERKELERRYLQAQKMEAVGQLAGGVAHDFNNVLTAILGYGEFVMDTLTIEDARHAHMTEVLTAAGRAAGLTRQLLAFSRRQVLEPRIVDPNELIARMEAMLRPLIGENIALECALGADVGRIKVDPGQLEQVIMNLAVNARDAMPRGGRLTIESANATLDEGVDGSTDSDGRPLSHVMITITDTGTGMTDEVRARIFEPFFTTKAQGKGTGLGLATSFGIIKQSGGHIAVFSEPDAGTAFKIYLPLVDEPRVAITSVRDTRVEPGGTETILLVEDEEAVRKLAGNILRARGYTVLEACNGIEAMGFVVAHAGAISLVVTDVVMPHMGGLELSERLGELHRGIRFLFCSGYTDAAVTNCDMNAGYLQKPYSPTLLAAKVREVLDVAMSP